MYGRIYTIRVAPTAVSAALDFLEIRPAAEKPVIVHKVVISPTASETNQQVEATVRTLPATLTSGSGGSTPVIGKKAESNAAAGFAVEAFNTTRATSSGTVAYHADEGFPSQGGFEYLPDISERPIVKNGEAFVVGIEESLGGALVGGYAVVEEI
jgi:hypothetical protein